MGTSGPDAADHEGASAGEVSGHDERPCDEVSGQEAAPCGEESAHEEEEGAWDAVSGQDDGPWDVVSGQDEGPCGPASGHEEGPCGAASGQEEGGAVSLDWRCGSGQESSLRGGSGQEGSWCPADLGVSGQDCGRCGPEFSVAIAAGPPEVVSGSTVISGFDVPGMISWDFPGDAGGSAAKRAKPYGSVGGSCNGRSASGRSGSAGYTTATRVFFRDE
ncbi:hypothetical protein GCM10022419_078160 [Nonomuraea rosea]|uniref:Uncharacterized protein n=1 Tax=Nonomuraea rosea TaxID=638574 RepID=A0ABP6YKF5_9ACTN